MAKVDVIEKTCVLVVKLVDFQRNKPLKNVNVKVFRLETEPITPDQWAENLKNGAPFKRLILSANTDTTGVVVRRHRLPDRRDRAL